MPSSTSFATIDLSSEKKSALDVSSMSTSESVPPHDLHSVCRHVEDTHLSRRGPDWNSLRESTRAYVTSSVNMNKDIDRRCTTYRPLIASLARYSPVPREPGLFAVGCSLLASLTRALATHYSLFTTRQPRASPGYSLLAAHYSPVADHETAKKSVSE